MPVAKTGYKYLHTVLQCITYINTSRLLLILKLFITKIYYIFYIEVFQLLKIFIIALLNLQHSLQSDFRKCHFICGQLTANFTIKQSFTIISFFIIIYLDQKTNPTINVAKYYFTKKIEYTKYASHKIHRNFSSPLQTITTPTSVKNTQQLQNTPINNATQFCFFFLIKLFQQLQILRYFNMLFIFKTCQHIIWLMQKLLQDSYPLQLLFHNFYFTGQTLKLHQKLQANELRSALKYAFIYQLIVKQGRYAQIYLF
eukprot:TRINITY_DN4127_c0_g1_i7.p1 TRINITY_DN4127_c0_g1~~TRINITY_DN4127_c0_g1_i7.p1  ORF type:complete len:256 (+),score=-22.01 TRINITY_DN4127_c0_g1_i7:163-930(+)